MKDLKILAVFTCAIAMGCTTSKRSSTIAPLTQVAFIEYCQTTEGIAVEGDVPNGRRIGQPTYSFNHDDLSLTVTKNLGNINKDSAIALLGKKLILKGTAGQGITSILLGINKTPFFDDEVELVELTQTQVKLKINNTPISIKIGQKWEEKTVQRDTLQLSSTAIVETISTKTITFHGLIARTKLNIN